ncbi:predicted CDS Pa_6_5640 [Pseudomonas sp. St29]|nr:predicted CDS Pa_6_5640 [Pseudomonas sp. St29]
MAMEPASSPQGAVARDSGMMAMAPRINAARGRRTLDITPCTQMTDADCASWHGAWLERSCAIAHRRAFFATTKQRRSELARDALKNAALPP